MPRIVLHRIVHVKDECQEVSIDEPHIGFNMTEATEHMIAQLDLKPQILLERVSVGR